MVVETPERIVHVRRHKTSRVKAGWGLAAWFLLPAVLFMLVFVYIPAGLSLTLGFFHYHLLGVDTTFAGLSNFAAALSYPVFWTALENTLIFAAIMVPLTIVLSLALGFLLHVESRFYASLRTMVLLPYITPVIATSIGWLWMFNPQYGILNAVLSFFHLPTLQWLLSSHWAMPSVALYTLWHSLGFDVVIVMAAIGNIPSSVIDAARVDGASSWRLFRKILGPLLSPTMFFLVIITTLGTLQAFSQIYALSGGAATAGGPSYATTTLILLVYQTAFQDFHFSYAASMAFLLVILILLFTLMQSALAKRWVFYQ